MAYSSQSSSNSTYSYPGWLWYKSFIAKVISPSREKPDRDFFTVTQAIGAAKSFLNKVDVTI